MSFFLAAASLTVSAFSNSAIGRVNSIDERSGSKYTIIMWFASRLGLGSRMIVYLLSHFMCHDALVWCCAL